MSYYVKKLAFESLAKSLFQMGKKESSCKAVHLYAVRKVQGFPVKQKDTEEKQSTLWCSSSTSTVKKIE